MSITLYVQHKFKLQLTVSDISNCTNIHKLVYKYRIIASFDLTSNPNTTGIISGIKSITCLSILRHFDLERNLHIILDLIKLKPTSLYSNHNHKSKQHTYPSMFISQSQKSIANIPVRVQIVILKVTTSIRIQITSRKTK